MMLLHLKSTLYFFNQKSNLSIKVQRPTQHCQCLCLVETSQTMAILASTSTLASIEAEEETYFQGEEVVVEDQTPTLSILNHRTNSFNKTKYTRPTCQICGKAGHYAIDCYHWMDFAYQAKIHPLN